MTDPVQSRPGLPDEIEVMSEESLREARERLAIALEASDMGWFDLDMTTMEAVTSFRHNQIFGYTEPVAAWSPSIFLDHVVEEDHPRVEEAFDKARQTGRFDLTARVRWPDGSIRWMRDWGRMYRDQDGTPVRMIGVTEDVTDAMRAKEALRAARKEAEEASRAKSRFLAMMSHELRTPLTAIIGSAELLQARVAEAGDRELAALDRIRSSAWHMATLVDDLLTLARSEEGTEEVRPRNTDVAKTLREVAAIVRPDARSKGLDLRLEGIDQPITLRTDAGKLRQIIMNLAANAVKYTSAGHVAVSVGTGGPGVCIRVRDTGPGIAPEDRERIFDPFTRADEGPGAAGSGLGLAIARRLAHLLGGDLELESEVGRGSTFVLRLPSLAA